MRHTAPLVAVFAAAALALTACGGDPGGGELSYEDSPLNKYFNAGFGGDMDPDEQQRQFEQMQKEVEELTAACMAKEGFDYVPVDYSQSGRGVVFDNDTYQPDSRDWVAQYGYGAINDPYADRMPEEPTQELVNPNQKYIESLSESEQAAYYEALYGPPYEEVPLEPGGAVIEAPTPEGCANKAWEEAYGGQQSVYNDEQFKPLMDAMQVMYENSQNDPKIAELDGAWASCMADAGESGFIKQNDAQESIYNELNKLYE